MKRVVFCGILWCCTLMMSAQSWPVPQAEAKAGTRWWWLGSAVDHDGLLWNLDEYARAGIGAVEITPLYGVQGNERNERPFLSPSWMEALREVEEMGSERSIEVDMNCGTGWPFGGPEVPIEEAACKAVFIDTLIRAKTVDLNNLPLSPPEKERPYAQLQCVRAFPTAEADRWRVIAVYASRTRQRVKRAAPGGEGWVIDHFDRDAVRHYLDRFDRAFASTGTPYPHTFFNDSYEVYGANWTPTLFDEFSRRRGYRLEDHLPELLGDEDDSNQTLADYRETLSDLLYENFTQQWVEWAHGHGVQVRNQAHGSPANLLDLYALVDIPEIEGFGLTDFGIKGLRTDPGMTRKNFSDMSMLKYASSAAHVMGKPFTSSETCTWLTEHFRTSLSQMKPDIDLMFTCGVNHVFFHGSCYTPPSAAWPGWKFYASVDMSPTNSIWRDAPYLLKYIERCQSFLQDGEPDNDFLVYLPVHDMWLLRGPRNDDDKGASWNRRKGQDLLMQFDIHTMHEKAPLFIQSILRINSLGYDCDYVSDRQLDKVRVEDGMLVTEGGTRYKALIIPTSSTMTPSLKKAVTRFPELIVHGEDPVALRLHAQPEEMREEMGLRAIRRKNGQGHFYFIANLTPDDKDSMVTLAVNCQDACWFNPMDGGIERALVDGGKVRINLRSGESRILQTYRQTIAGTFPRTPIHQEGDREEIDLTERRWNLSFVEESPKVERNFTLDHLQGWERMEDDSARVTMGTGVYTTRLHLNAQQSHRRWRIELGDVRESARVYINGTFVGCAWAAPFTLDCHDLLHEGDNELRIEVTNLPANRIADMDRQGIKWRKMKDLNMVDLDYRASDYSTWAIMPSGLNGTVKLVQNPDY